MLVNSLNIDKLKMCCDKEDFMHLDNPEYIKIVKKKCKHALSILYD